MTTNLFFLRFKEKSFRALHGLAGYDVRRICMYKLKKKLGGVAAEFPSFLWICDFMNEKCVALKDFLFRLSRLLFERVKIFV